MENTYIIIARGLGGHLEGKRVEASCRDEALLNSRLKSQELVLCEELGELRKNTKKAGATSNRRSWNFIGERGGEVLIGTLDVPSYGNNITPNREKEDEDAILFYMVYGEWEHPFEYIIIGDKLPNVKVESWCHYCGPGPAGMAIC